MSGIFYDPGHHRLHRVASEPALGWQLVTHDLSAGLNRCRRIMTEWLPPVELLSVQWHDEPAAERRSA